MDDDQKRCPTTGPAGARLPDDRIAAGFGARVPVVEPAAAVHQPGDIRPSGEQNHRIGGAPHPVPEVGDGEPEQHRQAPRARCRPRPGLRRGVPRRILGAPWILPANMGLPLFERDP
ncbi:hypothetical protein [Streptomyces sp. NPDC048637]|uniref:hypothetical protein n=1 Tax=Streptomyces sp. NPDC048637 TaxID=3155636 RepID=UPI003419DBBF